MNAKKRAWWSTGFVILVSSIAVIYSLPLSLFELIFFGALTGFATLLIIHFFAFKILPPLNKTPLVFFILLFPFQIIAASWLSFIIQAISSMFLIFFALVLPNNISEVLLQITDFVLWELHALFIIGLTYWLMRKYSKMKKQSKTAFWIGYATIIIVLSAILFAYSWAFVMSGA